MRAGRTLSFGVGAAAGVAAVVGYYLTRRDRHEVGELERQATDTERRVRARLDGEGIRPGTLRVSALTPHIVELSGTVPTEEEARDVVGRVQAVDGVRTVVNRLEVTGEASRLARNRGRYASGSPEMTESHWYGQRVGTGRRRQSEATDPDRPSDKVPMVTAHLGTADAQDAVSEPVEKQGPAVEDHTTQVPAPTHYGDRNEPAGFAGEANAPEQDMNAGERVVENVKPGVQRAIEDAGLERDSEETPER